MDFSKRRWFSRRTICTHSRPIVSSLESRIAPATFIVANTSTSGAAGSGSFRRAIIDANALAGADTIVFNIPAAGVQTIKINSTLDVTESVVIDGWSQPGFSTTPLIELTASSSQHALMITNGGTTVQGLIVNGFSLDGIFLDGGANNIVRGCWIGTDKTGLLDDGNKWGIAVRDAAATIIGGTTAKDRNVISGNDVDNIRIWGPNADGTKVIGNYIGTDTTGLAPISGKAGQGGMTGVWLGDTYPTPDIGSPDHITIGGLNPGERNVIGGMSRTGVQNFVATHDNLIQGNYVGVSADGKSVIANLFGVTAELDSFNITIDRNVIASTPVGGVGNVYSQGVIIGGTAGTAHHNIVTGNLMGLTPDGLSQLGQMDHGVVIVRANNNRVGGTTVAERNVICGATFDDVGFYGSDAFANVVQGNYLGTDITGTKAIGGGLRGVWIGDNYPPSIGAAHDNTVGGTAPGAANVIAGNGGAGIWVTLGAHHNTIQGNFIGSDTTGTINLGNFFGIFMEINSANNTIGGSTSGAGNVIAFNKHDGILVGYDKNYSAILTPAGAANRISGNAIFDNGDLGIDLGSDDLVTPNDPLDADTGPNLLQNYPVIVSAKSGAVTLVSGVLKSAANTSYTVEFFASKSADSSGFGEGGRYLGSTTITTDATGRGMFIDKSVSGATTAGELITATATDVAGNTSEFSNAVLVNVLPRVTSLVVNGGEAQRSRVTSLTVNFNQFVSAPLSAFELKRQLGNLPVNLSITLTTDLFTSAKLTFTGGPVEATSLSDGRYTFTALAAQISNANGALDGDVNGTGGDNYIVIGNPATNKLFRFFGDSDGDGAVAANDFIQFRLAFGGFSFMFDFDNDGAVAANDFIQFRLRFGGSI